MGSSSVDATLNADTGVNANADVDGSGSCSTM